jgi:L-ascorbate metabolism protein UlaG (beta-lactamase superfamily)
VIVLDPWIEGNQRYPRAHLRSVGRVLISHGHYDQFTTRAAGETVQAAVVCIFETGQWLEAKVWKTSPR